MEEKFENINREMVSVIVTTIIAMTIFEVMNIFFNIFTTGYYYTSTYSYKFSFVIGIIVYTLCFAIFKKSSRATGICYSLIFILNLTMQLKVMYTGEPIYFSDLKFFTQIPFLFNLAVGNISINLVISFLVIFIIYAIFLFSIFFIHSKYNIDLKSKKIRIAIIVVDILLLVFLFVPNKFTKDVFLKVFFNTEEYLDYDSYTTNYNYYLKVGMINGMYGMVLNNQFLEPNNYNKEELNNILKQNENKVQKTLGKPNIIIVFSESFFDIDNITEIEFSQEVTSNFNKLKKEGKSVELISPTYGGMSENVAFELFTGANMNYFPKGYIPIMSLYSRKNSENMPSLVKVLGNNGYMSKIIFIKDAYNSEKAFNKMGFKEYVELCDTVDSKDLTDELGISKVIDALKNKPSSEPIFCVLETYEGHMPYSKNKYNKYNIEIKKSNLSEEEEIAVRAYSQAIHNSDKQLNRLYEYIKKYDEPTIILFLGDHLPYLYTQNNINVIDKLEYFNTDNELLNYYRKYNTECLILANFDIEKANIPQYSGTDLLLCNLINQMDIESTEYYKWLNSTKDTLAASNRYISLDRDGTMYDTNSLPSEIQEIYDLRNNMQYMNFIK